LLSRAPEQEKQKGEARNHVAAEIEERFVEKVAERNDYQYGAERDERFTNSQAENEESTGDKFYEWDNYADKPKGPNGQKRVGERKEIFSRMFYWSELKDFHDPGHEKDQTKHESRENYRPAALMRETHSAASIFAGEGEGLGKDLGILFTTFWNCGWFSCHL
jgi:hypothetical protein